MKQRVVVCVSAVFLTVLSCGAVQQPQSLLELEELVTIERADLLQKKAPNAWAEGMRYLAMAREAHEMRNTRQVRRFAMLGVIQIKTALAIDEQSRARMRLAAAYERKQVLVREQERVQAAVDRIEQEQERLRIRRHIERVVDQAKRQAAAAEELREKGLTDEGRALLSDARRQVGQEMLARATVQIDMLEALVAAGVPAKTIVAYVKGETKLAKVRLRELDLAGLQQQVENIGIEIGRALDDVWKEHPKERDRLQKEIAEKLSTAGFDVIKEELGLTVRFVLPRLKKGKLPKGWDKPFFELGEALKEYEQVHVVVFASKGSFQEPKKSERQSLDRAKSALDSLIKAGFPKQKAHARGCGASSPLVALQNGSERVAILLVPVLSKK